MDCPNCSNEMYMLESGSFSHSNDSCPLAYRPWSAYEIKIIGDAMAATRSQALQEAAQVADDWQKEAQDDDITAECIAREIRALAAQPTAAPACPNCGEPMQCGTTWLCIKDGQTVMP